MKLRRGLDLRTQWYRSLAVAYLWKKKAWDDDQKFTLEDVDETIYAAAALAFIWKGNVILAAVPGVAIAEGIVVAGAVVSYVIAGEEGVEDFIDFYMEPTKIPERLAFTAETIYEQKIKKPLVSAAEAYVGWWDRRAEEIKLVWSITRPQSLW